MSLKRTGVTTKCAEFTRILIDYIMIDPDYNGEFSAEISVTDNYDDIKFISRGNVAYIVVDILVRVLE